LILFHQLIKQGFNENYAMKQVLLMFSIGFAYVHCDYNFVIIWRTMQKLMTIHGWLLYFKRRLLKLLLNFFQMFKVLVCQFWINTDAPLIFTDSLEQQLLYSHFGKMSDYTKTPNKNVILNLLFSATFMKV